MPARSALLRWCSAATLDIHSWQRRNKHSMMLAARLTGRLPAAVAAAAAQARPAALRAAANGGGRSWHGAARRPASVGLVGLLGVAGGWASTSALADGDAAAAAAAPPPKEGEGEGEEEVNPMTGESGSKLPDPDDAAEIEEALNCGRHRPPLPRLTSLPPTSPLCAPAALRADRHCPPQAPASTA